jgi:glycerol kinase
MDTRTQSTVDELLQKCNKNVNVLKEESGLPLSTYFSALKIKWMMDNVLQVKDAIKEDRCAFGTVDTWILWVFKLLILLSFLNLKLINIHLLNYIRI